MRSRISYCQHIILILSTLEDIPSRQNLLLIPNRRLPPFNIRPISLLCSLRYGQACHKRKVRNQACIHNGFFFIF